MILLPFEDFNICTYTNNISKMYLIFQNLTFIDSEIINEPIKKLLDEFENISLLDDGPPMD